MSNTKRIYLPQNMTECWSTIRDLTEQRDELLWFVIEYANFGGQAGSMRETARKIRDNASAELVIALREQKQGAQ